MSYKIAFSYSLLCLALISCGGGSSGGGSDSNDERITLNGNLATPDDGARALSGLLLVVNGGASDVDLDIDQSDFGPNGDPCNTSGDASLVRLTGNSATVDFDECQNIVTEDGASSDTTIDGLAQLICNDGFNTCNNNRINFGNDTNTLAVDILLKEGETTEADANIELAGRIDTVSSENAAGDETNNATFNLSGSIDDQLDNRNADFQLSELAVTSIDFANDNTSLSVSGDYEITSSNNCLNGGANVVTSQAFVFDENDSLQPGGQLALSNNSGERVTIVASGVDQLTITSVDGQSQTYTISQIEAFCQSPDASSS